MLKRIIRLLKAFGNLLIGGVESMSPEMLLENEKQTLRENISKFNEGLASHAGQAEILMNHIKRQRKDIKKLHQLVELHLSAGDETTAARYALQLENLQKDLLKNEEQLEAAEQTYQKLKAARDQAVKSAETRLQKLGSQLNQLKIQEATAELIEMGNSMIGSIGGSGDTLNRLEAMVSERKAKAIGRTRVAFDSQDTLKTEILFTETDEKEALTRYKQAKAELPAPNAGSAFQFQDTRAKSHQ